MLDTKGRKYVDPLIDLAAERFINLGLAANTVTGLAFLVGSMAGFLVYLGYTIPAVTALWVSGFLDAVDGSMARRTKTSPWGTVLDVTYDRVVEIGVIVGLAGKYPAAVFPLLLLCASIIISMTVFLTVGAVSENKGKKSFYYQAGLAERTEGFICFTLMMVFTNYLIPITYIFFGLILFTAGQRLMEARRLLI
ncbi:MAG TPA: CDP-alcohol phosphatidyltransferase family protein [Bacillota bacterium]|nr:CDP-alcohol phosphatidyltransferase family protein [Bacillota bacterium]